MCYSLNPGNVWNPLTKYRNIPCPCGSGKKAKKCHGLLEWVTKKDAETIMNWISENNLLLEKHLKKNKN